MRLKITKGAELLGSYYKGFISVYDDDLYINFLDKGTYTHFIQKGKTITIYVKDDPTEDMSTKINTIVLTFTGEVDEFIFNYYEKDQLALKRLKFYSFHSENAHRQEDVTLFKAVGELATYLGNEIVVVPLVRDYQDEENKGLYTPINIGVYKTKIFHHTEVIDCILRCWYDETTSLNTGEFHY